MSILLATDMKSVLVAVGGTCGATTFGGRAGCVGTAALRHRCATTTTTTIGVAIAVAIASFVVRRRAA
jgi:hypothetical protein